MKAVVGTNYCGPDKLELTEIDTPVAGADEVLIQVRASSVNPLDWHIMRGHPHLVRLGEGLRRPRRTIPGVDVAGIVEAVGGEVTGLRPGDEVLGSAGGSLAEYVTGAAKELVLKPAEMTFEQAATLACAGCTALQALRDHGQLQPGQRVLVNGAAGGVGTFTVQIAKALGAHVTGVCSTGNVEMVRSIGADSVVDYTSEDFTRQGERYDLIVDAVGNRSLADLRRGLKPKGTLVLVGAGDGNWVGALALPLKALLMSRFVSQRLLFFMAKICREDLLVLTELAAAGKLTPVIDRTYQLAASAEAIAYLEAGHARGKIVVTP
jgi:NADPH:quinone reductase-like Zn-dependent oxidoreductase